MRVSLEDKPWVRVGNPKTAECEAVRMNLLPGILKTIAANKHVALPIRLFEVNVNWICSYIFLFFFLVCVILDDIGSVLLK